MDKDRHTALEEESKITVERMQTDGGFYGLYSATKSPAASRSSAFVFSVMPSIGFLRRSSSSGSTRSLRRQSESKIREYSLLIPKKDGGYNESVVMKHQKDRSIREEITSFLRENQEYFTD
jgi:hypothetical protein